MHHDIYKFKLRKFHGNSNSRKSILIVVESVLPMENLHMFFDNGVYSKTKCSRDTMNKQI